MSNAPKKYDRWDDPKHDRYLKKNFRTKTNKELAEHLNRTVDGVRKRLTSLGLIRTPEDVRKLKSVKGERTTYKPEGETKVEIIDGRPFRMIKINKNWMKQSEYNWKRAGRTIPEGHELFFKDGNSLKDGVRNLLLVKSSDLKNGVLVNRPAVNQQITKGENKKPIPKVPTKKKVQRDFWSEVGATKKEVQQAERQFEKEQRDEAKKQRELDWAQKYMDDDEENKVIVPDFDPLEGKRAIRVDHRTTIFVPINATKKEIAKRIAKYKR